MYYAAFIATVVLFTLKVTGVYTASWWTLLWPYSIAIIAHIVLNILIDVGLGTASSISDYRRNKEVIKEMERDLEE